MKVEMITYGDLLQFKSELFEELKAVLQFKPIQNVEFLKSRDVLNRLKISNSTLQTYRRSGKIECKKVGGIWYYSNQSLNQLMTEND